MAAKLVLDGRPVTVDVAARKPALLLVLDGVEHEVIERESARGEIKIVIDGVVFRGFRYVTSDGEVHVRLAGRTFFVQPEDRSVREAASGGDGVQEFRADFPGRVIARHVEPGAIVAAGDPLITIESMKLQMTLAAKHGGRVERVSVESDASFERGAHLLRVVPIEAEGKGRAE